MAEAWPHPPAAFDAEYYRAQLDHEPESLWQHYLEEGAAAGLDPSSEFSTRRYLTANPDVASAGVNPLMHWVRFGQYEGRGGGMDGWAHRGDQSSLGPLPRDASVVWLGPEQASSRGGSSAYVWDAGQRAWRMLPPREPMPLAGEAIVTLRQALVAPRAGVAVGDWRMQSPALGGSGDLVQARYRDHPQWPLVPLPRVDSIPEAVLLAQPGDAVFGHQLIDVLPRLLSFQRAGLGHVPMLLRAPALNSLTRVLESVGLTGIELRELPAKGAIEVGTLHVATFARRHLDFHPERMQEVREVLRRPLPARTEGAALWMSREGYAQLPWPSRFLVNRGTLDAAASDAGFEVIRPEELDLGDVLGSLAAGGIVGGEDGSALHNSLVMPPRSEVLLVSNPGFVDGMHTRLADALGHTVYAVPGRELAVPGQEETFARDRDWEVPAEVVADLPRILGSTRALGGPGPGPALDLDARRRASGR